MTVSTNIAVFLLQRYLERTNVAVDHRPALRSVVGTCLAAIERARSKEAVKLADDVLSDLAQAYADHPGFRNEWNA